MRNLTTTLGRFVVVLSGALALGSCSRSDYAFLPKGDSYLGTATAAPKVRRAAPVATVTTPAQAVEASPITGPAVAPEITVATAPAAARPAATVPKAAAPATEAAEVAAAPATATVATPAPQKLSLVQRIALAKVTKKLNKLATKSQFKQGDNIAHTARINGNLRTGLILLLIGLIVGIFSNIIGLIIALVGVIFIVLWLLDEL
ncbi:hypothetical protein GCM10023172_41770 [Hymenobacter ginsengisoli]|uniref:Uncharacterized protein n=1 Tax=Hymenobacter ginsengisoli TaxID=1051626 RepID=A0ABP8QSS3_9BACT|nr:MULTISPECIES: hypothetical protein [unclassified Hymenobacter]MBO2032180.1 hypothetical protein [Hymenobacter sp. BT559]